MTTYTTTRTTGSSSSSRRRNVGCFRRKQHHQHQQRRLNCQLMTTTNVTICEIARIVLVVYLIVRRSSTDTDTASTTGSRTFPSTIIINFRFVTGLTTINHPIGGGGGGGGGENKTTGTNNSFYQRRYNCSYQLDTTNDGPNFNTIVPSTTIYESKVTLPQREYNILSYYAHISFPRNSSTDDYVDPQQSYQFNTTNPQFNSREDVARITSRYISRILLGCYNNTDLDEIILHPSTIPFALFGTSGGSGAICARDGDYDFVTIDLIQLLYVSHQYPNSIPSNVYDKIVYQLLTIYGTINTNNTISLQCQLRLLPVVPPLRLTIAIVDTENHILQTQISRYLTNQLLLSMHINNNNTPVPNATDDNSYNELLFLYNNTANGNTDWLLQYLSQLVQTYFYEYNSRPYQLYTVKSLSVLHSYAMDTSIVLLCEILLDLITIYSSIQMNHLRRFVPYRRQPSYTSETISWKGDSEFYRIALLVGNFQTFAVTTTSTTTNKTNNNTIPGHPSLGGLNFVSTIASTYRVNEDFIYPLFFRTAVDRNSGSSSSNSEYYISNHHVAEIYYSTSKVLLSSGGHESKSMVPQISLPNRFCFFTPCLWDGGIFRTLVERIYISIDREERGWSRPTTIIPSNERSDDIINMIRFQGHRSTTHGRTQRNLCVGPNFACGLQFTFGNIVEPILKTCSVVNGDWRFIDFTTVDCLNYGYYMAVYIRPCSKDIECNDVADNYGVLEISELTTGSTMSFGTFQTSVLSNNPKPFLSKGVHTYTPMSGNAIQFEIHPKYEYESQIIKVEGIDRDNSTLILDRTYHNWPKAWSSKGSFQSISMTGRYTFDTSSNSSSTNSSNIGQRCISDVTDPLNPKRIISTIPFTLRKHPMQQQQPSSSSLYNGRYFDDSTSVVSNDTIQSIQFYYTYFGGVTGFRMTWRKSGLHSEHGYIPSSPPSTGTTTSTSIGSFLSQRVFGSRMIEYEFNIDDNEEYIVTVGIGTTGTTTSSWFIQQQRRRIIHRIRMVTNRNNSIVVGYGTTEDIVYSSNNNKDDHHKMIAFYGWASDDQLYELGVISIE